MQERNGRAIKLPSNPPQTAALIRLLRPATETRAEREMRVLRVAAALMRPSLPLDPEHAIHSFGLHFGDPDGLRPQSVLEWDTSQLLAGVLTARATITSATDFDKLDALGWLRASDRHLRGYFTDAHRVSTKWPSRGVVVRALAVHYLSTRGGGILTMTAAADRYTLQDTAGDADRNTWSLKQQRDTVAKLERDFGPLP